MYVYYQSHKVNLLLPCNMPSCYHHLVCATLSELLLTSFISNKLVEDQESELTTTKGISDVQKSEYPSTFQTCHLQYIIMSKLYISFNIHKGKNIVFIGYLINVYFIIVLFIL